MATAPVSVAPEFEVEAVLRDGLTALHTNSDLIRRLFDRYQSEEIEEAVTYMREHEIPVRLGLAPIDVGTLMTVPIVVVGWAVDEEDESRDFLGDFAQPEDYTEEEWDQQLPGRHYQGIMERGTIQIAIYGNDARHATLLYRLVKAILLLAAMRLEAAGVLNRVMSGGVGLKIDNTLFPEYTVGRGILLKFDHTFLVGVDEALMGALNVVVSAVAGSTVESE